MLPSLRTVFSDGSFASSAARALNPSVLCCAVVPSSHVIWSDFRAVFAFQNESATIATPESRPSSASPPATTNDIRLHHLAAEHGALLEHRVLHAGNDDVDPEQRFAGDDLLVVDTRDARAEEVIVLGVLERNGLRVRNRQRGGERCQ
jgi:hypothetical protein